jgi:hypothetical protein
MARWKTAFFVMLGVWVLTSAFLAYEVIDLATAAHDMREGYADCEVHRDYLQELAKGRVTRAEVQATRPPTTRSANDDEREVSPDDFRTVFDAQGRYLASEYGASSAGEMTRD